MTSEDIRKTVVLRAPIAKVWGAVSDASQFGKWFGVALDAPFVAGKEATGKITPTIVDPEVAKQQAPYAGMPWRAVVDRIEPMTLFSFRWHPYAVDPDKDYAKEPMTLVTFRLSEVAEGTLLEITETGFADIPASRRDEALKSNDEGWAFQAQLIAKYLAQGQDS